MLKLFDKDFFKFFIGFALILIAGFGMLYFISRVSAESSQAVSSK